MKAVAIALLLVGVGCGGAPFTMIDGVGVVDAQADAIDAGLTVGNPTVDAQVDSPMASEAAADAGAETTVEAAVDAGIDTAPPPPNDAAPPPPPYDAGSTCTSQPDTTFGCGPPITVSKPSHFCVDQWGAASPPAISVATPIACQCVETYNCDCLLAYYRGQPICRYGTFMSCVIGTTGGMVVTCR